MSINGFTVQHSDGIKTADYAPPRTTSITANVVVMEGQSADAALDAALALVIDRVKRSLYGGTAVQAPAAPGPQTEGAPAARTRRTKAQIEADEAAAKAAASAGASTGPSGEGGTSGEEFPDAGSGGQQEAPPAAEGSEWDTPPAEVTDDAMIKAVTEKNGSLQAAGMSAEAAPVPIRELIASYNPDPTKSFGIKNIPAEKRADFLAKLGAIQPKKAA